MGSLYKPKGEKKKILMLDAEFPSDIFAAESWINIRGLSIKDNLIFTHVTDCAIESN